jgi:hypothetical protein
VSFCSYPLLEMPFTTLEVQLIHRVVGEFCDRRIPNHVKDKVRLTYTIKSNEIVIFEERLVDNPSAWMEMEIAKLRYFRGRNEWRLYWKRANDKWWPYETRTKLTTLEAMVREIDEDSHGCFFG